MVWMVCAIVPCMLVDCEYSFVAVALLWHNASMLKKFNNFKKISQYRKIGHKRVFHLDVKKLILRVKNWQNQLRHCVSNVSFTLETMSLGKKKLDLYGRMMANLACLGSINRHPNLSFSAFFHRESSSTKVYPKEKGERGAKRRKKESRRSEEDEDFHHRQDEDNRKRRISRCLQAKGGVSWVLSPLVYAVAWAT